MFWIILKNLLQLFYDLCSIIKFALYTGFIACYVVIISFYSFIKTLFWWEIILGIFCCPILFYKKYYFIKNEYYFLKQKFFKWYYSQVNSRDILFIWWVLIHTINSIIVYFIFNNWIWFLLCISAVLIFHFKYEKSFRRGNLGTPRTIALWSIYWTLIIWLFLSYFIGTFWL